MAPSAPASASLFVLAAEEEEKEEELERPGSCGAEEERCYSRLVLMQSGFKCPVKQRRRLKKDPECFAELDDLLFPA